MKNLRVVLAVLAIFVLCQCVFAHDGTFGDFNSPIDVPTMDTIEFIHDETVNNPLDEHKGWAFLGLQNNTGISWTDFHIQLSTDDPAKPVIFVITSPYEPLASVTLDSYTLTESDTKLNFYFDNDPVLPGQIVTFQVYTDNTAYSNDTFTLCMTPTPEPATLLLLGAGGLLIRKRK